MENCPVSHMPVTLSCRGKSTRRHAFFKLLIAAVCLISPTFGPDCLYAERPFGATNVDQSAFALGSFALNVVFVESNGSIDPNQEDWTEAQLTTMHGKIEEAAVFWESMTSSYHPNAQLDITVNYVNGGVPLETGYEPITRAGFSSNSLWVNQVMNTLGYVSANVTYNNRDFNNDQRDALDTHWAATVYVVNDEVDSDGRFSDNQFAFTYLGGPYIVTTYSNDGWGNDRYHRVLAHEMGHLFFAMDEYQASGKRNNARSGYLNGVNGNAELNSLGQPVTPPQPDALMLDTTLDPSEFTSVQIGHLDSDNDSIPDILDTVPYIVGSDVASDPDAGIFSFTGQGFVNPMENNNPNSSTDSGADMTINTIDFAAYNLDGHGWIDFAAVDGAYGDYVESLSLELTGLAPGPHTIDLRITNSVGNYSEVESFELFVTPEPGALGVLCMGMLVCLRRGRKARGAKTAT